MRTNLRRNRHIKNADMAKPDRHLQKTHLRAWRKHRNLTLAHLVDRLNTMYGFETTEASLSRIERGQQPYNQHLLEALADALACEPADLLVRHPNAPDDIRLVWSQLSPDNQKRAIEILRLLKTG